MAAAAIEPTPLRSLEGMNEEELEEYACELSEDAERHRLVSRSLFGEAAKARARAQRMREREQEEADRRFARRGGRPKAPKVELPYDPHDTLISAAAVATEDLETGFDAGALAEKLAIGRPRAQKLLLALEAKELVARMGDATKWRAIDPDEPRVRDAARALGQFTVEQLADAVGMTPLQLTHYIDWMRDEQMIVGAGPMYDFRKLDPETTITELNGGRYRLPEKEPPAGTEILSPRGAPVMIVDHGKSAQATTRHREKLRAQRREAMASARAQRSERDKAKSAANRDGSSKSKGRRKRK